MPSAFQLHDLLFDAAPTRDASRLLRAMRRAERQQLQPEIVEDLRSEMRLGEQG
jgi:hypothetical protein